MTLRAKIVLYLILIHVVMGTIAVFVLMERPALLFAIEALFVLSILLGVMLVRAFFVPLEMIRTGSDLIEEQDFTTHFREVGQKEMDRLIAIYNRMVDRLRDERVRLEEQNLLLARIIEASPSGIVILDFDGAIEQINPSALAAIGRTRDEVRGRTLENALPRYGGELAALGPGQSTLLAPDGRRRIRVVAGEFYDRGFDRRFLVLEELTEELRATEKAAFEKLIRMMSHEVNNSVGAVTSLLDSLRHYAPQIRIDDREDFSNAATVAINRLGSLEQFMAAFAEVVRLPEPRKEACDVGRLVEDIAVLFRPQLEGHGIGITAATDRDLVVTADKNQVEQVLVNAVRNAAESIGTNGRIELSARHTGEGVVVTVADDGRGIAPDVRERLFTPFFTTKREGRGIGLMLMQEILAQHGFAFSLQPREPRGAELRIVM